MTVTSASFRADFPAFQAPTFTPSQIDWWIGLGVLLMDPGRWGSLLDKGLELFVAHQLSLEAMSSRNGQGVPGAIAGPVSSASVDKVAYSRDASAAMLPDAGHWNLSTYGLRFLQLQRMVGAGPVQIGAPGGVDSSSIDNGVGFQGWPGVIYPPSSNSPF